MIDLAREIVGALFLVAGGTFFLIGAIGVHRMPDLFTRIHAASLADTAGVGLVLIGLMVYGGLTLVTVKLVFLLLFLMFMGPVATHALAAAALQAGLKPGAEKRHASSPARKTPVTRKGRGKSR
ncbi:cation:proton antiporter [Kaistia algarum]|uniref:monovalent cation/H(+) antiporter subunit G n=1 Tax=Kaistia algarum TaxID=2083279 RepID=UPI000CE92109|nr:monovalent cation/H(+) antiporter subunit G [Kaistia algarum]MCX5512176.1 monovalent cation/H(+) antiporter subunit G [Kaistia algarum]PPE80274.1 cation:proton antiporter [Kaistia algarum]